MNIRASYTFLETTSKNSFFPCISVHIRRGDKSTEVANTPVERYVNRVVELTKEYPQQWTVLLLSDEERVGSEFMSQTKDQLKNVEVLKVNASQSR